MNYRVRLNSSVARIRIQPSSGIRVTSIPGELIQTIYLSQLEDVDTTNVKDKYVIMYDAIEQKYKTVNPDEVLSASSNSETTQPGLPTDFIDTLDIDLDNKIDIDGGSF